jgi:hypothetical protein
MSFEGMKKELIKQGLLDKDGKLTQKGHEYVETTKQELGAKTAKTGEEIERATREAEAILDPDDGTIRRTVRRTTAGFADVDS